MNPITEARELGRKAGLDPRCHSGLNPYRKGVQPSLWTAWLEGYDSTCPALTLPGKGLPDGLPHGGTEQFERK